LSDYKDLAAHLHGGMIDRSLQMNVTYWLMEKQDEYEGEEAHQSGTSVVGLSQLSGEDEVRWRRRNADLRRAWTSSWLKGWVWLVSSTTGKRPAPGIPGSILAEGVA
jgi:hypothetical protein